MAAGDICQRFIFEGMDIRGELVKLDASFHDSLVHQDYPPAVAGLLGEFLAASVLLAATVKFDGRLVLQARSKGLVSLIMAECSSERHLRGIARFEGDTTGVPFHALLRDGTLAITIEPARGESYQGIVPLENPDLAGCLQDYFTRSEQLESRFLFAVADQRVAGLMLQQLPPQTQPDPEARVEAWSTITQLAATLSRSELLELDPAQILLRLFNQQQVKIFPAKTVVHRCSCSRERIARALHALGSEDVLDIVAEQGGVQTNCEFCGRQYDFSGTELALLFEGPPGDRVH